MTMHKLMTLKSVVLAAMIGLFVMATFTPSQRIHDPDTEIITSKAQTNDCQYGRCTKIKADGTRCKNCAQRYSVYCWSHSK